MMNRKVYFRKKDIKFGGYMAYDIRCVEYFYCSVKDQPGEAYKILSILSELGITMLAFHAIPIGPNNTQLTIFPADPNKLISEAKKAGMDLEGPHPAFLVRGDDHLGALSDLHKKLFDASVNIYASNGVTDGEGDYGYVLYVRPEEFERAKETLEL
jgi:hypothetical protein